jgi:hypothetical protein
MKTLNPLLLAIALSLTLTSFAKKNIVSLKIALEKKLISAKATCKGGLNLNYSVQNLTKDSLMVIIPVGWRFNSNDPKNDYQDILVTKTDIIVLKTKEYKNVDIKGYCCELTKNGPIKGAPYTLGTLADSNLVHLARYLYIHPSDQNTEQHAIWAISDKEETANIAHANDSIADIIRRFVAILKNEPLPWYTLVKKANVSQTGTIYNIPIKFKADINVPVTKNCYSYCYIVNSKGEKISEIFGKWLLPEKTDYKAIFNVAGFKKGDYTLIMETEGLKLFEKEFKI